MSVGARKRVEERRGRDREESKQTGHQREETHMPFAATSLIPSFLIVTAISSLPPPANPVEIPNREIMGVNLDFSSLIPLSEASCTWAFWTSTPVFPRRQSPSPVSLCAVCVLTKKLIQGNVTTRTVKKSTIRNH